MASEGGDRCAKYFLYVLNGIFFLAGGLLIGIGLWIKFDNSVDRYFKHSQTTPLYAKLGVAEVQQTAIGIFIAFGAFIFVVGSCGCVGAVKGNRKLLALYVAFTGVIIAGELGGGLFAFIKFREVRLIIEMGIENDFRQNYKNGSSLINDALMKQFNCCGWNNSQDFAFMKPSLPHPCCKPSNLTASSNCSVRMAPDIYNGCGHLISDFISSSDKLFLGGAIGVIVMEILVLVSGIILFRSLGSNN